MDLELLFQMLFAVAVLAVAASFAATIAWGWAGRYAVVAAAALGLASAAGWIAFGFEPSAELAVAAAGLAGCSAAELVVPVLGRAIARNRRIDGELARAEAELAAVVAREAKERTAELERALARSRAESLSLLAQEERKIAAERRRDVAERERQASSQLTTLLAGAQARVDQRLASWADDIERAQQRLASQVAQLGQRQKQAVAEAEVRIEAEARRLDGDADAQRAAVVRLREDLARASQEAMTEAHADLETHAAERRRALHEVSERLRRRERELHEQIERQEGEAAARIKTSFADVERRQLEQLERALDRASNRHAEAAAHQFEQATKGARENAAKRLSRELDRAVAAYVREAQSVLAESLARVAEAGAQRVEKRFGQTAAGLERQRDEFVSALDRRLSEAESDLRRRVDALVADTEAERGVLEARLHDLARRIEGAFAQADERAAILRRRE